MKKISSSKNLGACALSALYMFILLLSIPQVCADTVPQLVSVDANPRFAAPGDSVTITATATDDVGVRRIYFYSPYSSDIKTQECADAPTCTKSVTQVVSGGDNDFCVKALDTLNQVSDLKCVKVTVSTDRPPVIKYFYTEPKEGDMPVVHVDGTMKFSIIAEDDWGVSTVSFNDVSGGTIDVYQCGDLKSCIFETKRMFTQTGIYTFCAWAVDTSSQESGKKCIDVHVVSKQTCEFIGLDDTEKVNALALRIKSKRLHMDTDGLVGYPAQCCKEYGFCEDLKIDSITCEKIAGNLPDDGYAVVQWDPNSGPIEDALTGYKYPQILCIAVSGGLSYVGVIDNNKYRVVGNVENPEENMLTYWLMGESARETTSTGNVLIYTTGGSEADPISLKDYLVKSGYNTELIQRTQKITEDLLSKYDQVWIMDTTPSTPLDKEEVDAVIEYHNSGGNLLLSGEGDGAGEKDKYIDAVKDIANAIGVIFTSPAIINNNQPGCVSGSFVSHPITQGISSLSTSGSDSDLSSGGDVKTVGTFEGKTGIMVMEASGGKGKVVFDSCFLSLMSTTASGGPSTGGPNLCDNSKYILNIVAWLKKTGASRYTALSDSGSDRYFFAEQLQQEENETKVSVIVDSVKYSDTVNKLMEQECMEKDLESGECTFDCLDTQCNPTAPCGSGNCLGCPKKPPCECCPECHKLMSYEECTYRKYEQMYGRPQVDYMFCWKIAGLKDTPWCYQKSDQPTSTVNFPWYGFTRKDDGYYRSLSSIGGEYVDEIHKWNANVEVREKPTAGTIAQKEWVPEVYCNHNFDPKLFRNIWTKIFTSTPFLNDLRNNLTWTRTGPGKLYAGGGFRREPACWWKCCERCAPFCDCACVAGCNGQLCCLQPHFSPPSVTNVIKVELPFTTVSEGSIDITYNDDRTIATVDNGAFNIISTGNMPFEVSASFSKDESAGEYTMILIYNPIGGFSGNMNHRADYDQFVIAQDIIFSYDLNEDAKYFVPAITERFATSLIDYKCSCVCPLRDPITKRCICPPTCGVGNDCCCCPSGSVTINTDESISDTKGTEMVLDTIKIEALRTAAYGFVDAATARGVNVGLVAFSSDQFGNFPRCPGGICSSHPLTTDAASLRDQIRLYSPLHGTCIACGIDKGIELLSGASGEKHMIVMSDGVPQCCLSMGGAGCPGLSEDMGKQESIDQATRAKGAGITVHTVALGNMGDVDLTFMENLAKAGGGKYYHVTCECGLECIYNELAQIVNDNAILVSDTTGSMSKPLNLNCPPIGTPVIHKFGAINISITGNIDNYMGKDITTGVRSKGNIKVDVKPDIVNRFVFNLGESSIDYYSLFYPVKHEASRKEFSYGKWLPGYPYAIGEQYLYEPSEQKRTYVFDDSYGYESAKFDYPEQCRNICPADCTCPAEDITDVTCTDREGNSYKRKDCVCLPAKGHSYETPCTSTRTFHEEEGYYFDFVDLETKEVASDINLMGQTGTNPQFTGSLRGDVSHNLKKKGGETEYQCQESVPEDWSLTENTILLPTDPQDAGAGDSQSEPLAVHGLAWRLAECATTPGLYGFSDADNIKIGRAMGPLEISGIKYNAGPYILTASTDPKNVVEKVVAKYPEFENVDYNALGAKAVSLKVNPIMPANVCIMDGLFDQPTQLFNEMHVPYIPWSKDCLNNADVLVFGCPSGPLDEATVDEVRSFVSNCGTYVATDLSYEVLDQIFPGYIKGDSEGDGSATLWEGTMKGSYDLPDDLRRFFQTPYETLSGWTLMGGTIVINGVNSDTKVLAKGDYSSGQTDKPMAVTFNYGQLGRVFYYPVHLEGAAQVNQRAFMSSFYASAGSTSRTPAGTGNTGTYELAFEAMNFPYSLIKYENEGWDLTVRGDDCSQFCGRGGMYAAPVCLSPVDASTKGCVYCNGTVTDVYAGCSTKCGPEHTEQRCCCAIPSFTTEDAKMILYIHFRDNTADQTFNLFPARQENKPYATVKIDVKVRDPSRLTCEAKPASTGPRQEVTVDVRLTDPLTGDPIPSEEVTINVEAYGVSQKVVTDGSGEAQYKFGIGEQSTKISCAYGSDKSSHTESYASAYVNVSSIDRFWWFLSPEVLLLLIVLILLAYSYRWFRISGKK